MQARTIIRAGSHPDQHHMYVNILEERGPLGSTDLIITPDETDDIRIFYESGRLTISFFDEDRKLQLHYIGTKHKEVAQ